MNISRNFQPTRSFNALDMDIGAFGNSNSIGTMTEPIFNPFSIPPPSEVPSTSSLPGIEPNWFASVSNVKSPINTSSALAKNFYSNWIQARGPSTGNAVFDQPQVTSFADGSDEAISTQFEEEASAVEDVIPEAEAVETGSGPIGSLIAAGQMAGQFLNMAIGQKSLSNIQEGYTQEMISGHGVGMSQLANAEATSEKANAEFTNAIGSAGAFLGGPIGVLLGRGIASFFDQTPNLNVANSSQGNFNPQGNDINTAQSQSSAMSGNNVTAQTSESVTE